MAKNEHPHYYSVVYRRFLINIGSERVTDTDNLDVSGEFMHILTFR